MHVLIIEDEPMIALDLQCFLEELGADTTDVADTEDDALSLAGEHRPDLITADYSLRRGTGPQAVSRIQHDFGAIPVIYITGQPERCPAGGSNASAISKPILWLQLAQAVKRHNLLLS